jgi:hypothetical protein
LRISLYVFALFFKVIILASVIFGGGQNYTPVFMVAFAFTFPLPSPTVRPFC